MVLEGVTVQDGVDRFGRSERSRRTQFQHDEVEEYSSQIHGAVLRGCASVLKMCVFKSRVSCGANSRYRYFIVSARKKLSMSSRLVFRPTFFSAAYATSVRQ